MEAKYILTNEKKIFGVRVLYRIKAVKNFGTVIAGEFGGFIESDRNLDHKGECWVFDNAIVCDCAYVTGNAKVRNKARIKGRAKIKGNANVKDNAVIYGLATVSGYAVVGGKARVFGYAEIFDYAYIFGKAKISKYHTVSGRTFCCSSLGNIEESIRVQTGLIPCNGEVIAYKQVDKNLRSFYDPEFEYKVGEWAETENPEISHVSCASGLHFSNANYYNQQADISKSTFLIAKIRLEDIITVQRGKIRCKRAFIMGKYDIK